MEDYNPNKVIDESKQGEALVIDAGLDFKSQPTGGKKLFLESYGCAMNFSDSSDWS